MVRCPWCQEKHAPSEECVTVKQEQLPLYGASTNIPKDK